MRCDMQVARRRALIFEEKRLRQQPHIPPAAPHLPMLALHARNLSRAMDVPASRSSSRSRSTASSVFPSCARMRKIGPCRFLPAREPGSSPKKRIRCDTPSDCRARDRGVRCKSCPVPGRVPVRIARLPAPAQGAGRHSDHHNSGEAQIAGMRPSGSVG